MSSAPDVLPEGATEVVGGPLGRHAAAATRSWRRLVPQIVALVVLPVAASVVQKGHCLSDGWSGTDQFWRACFSDLPAQYELGGLAGGLPAYLDGGARLDQPVLSGAVMATLGGLVPAGDALDETRWYLLLWAVVATALLMATVWCTAATRPRHLDAATQVALSPVVVLTVLLSDDVVAVALVAGAMLAWERRWLTAAGLLLGLGVTTRGYVLAVALALAYTAWRSDRLRDAVRVLGSGLVAALAVAVPFAVAGGGALTASPRAWWSAPASYGSPWLLPHLAGVDLPVGAVTALAVLGWLAAAGAGIAVVRGVWRPPPWPTVALVVVAVVLVTSKSVPVQASLWLLPLAALAGLRWRDHVLWAGAEAIHFVAVWLYIGGQSVPDRGLPAGWYAVALLLRLAAIGWVVSRAWSASTVSGPPATPRPTTPSPSMRSLSPE